MPAATIFFAAPVALRNSPPILTISEPAAAADGGSRAARRGLHVPDASADSAGRAGPLSDLWHGARTCRRFGRHRRHRVENDDASVVDLCGAIAADRADGDDRVCARNASAVDQRHGRWFGWIAVRCSQHRWCCGAELSSSSSAGNRFVNRSPNMFTLIALGVAAAYGFSVFALAVSADAARRIHDEWRAAALLRSRCDHHDAGDPGPGARIARTLANLVSGTRAARNSLHPQPCASTPTDRSVKSRSTKCMQAIGCVCARATRCRSMVWCLRADRISMNR